MKNGASVRTYAWVLVLGNTVVTWPLPMLFTERGVLVGLVHFSMPSMILVLAAALSHIDVSKALLISGMFMPKLLFAAFFAAGLAGLSAMLWATSVARSHDPFSWERATEKNKNT